MNVPSKTHLIFDRVTTVLFFTTTQMCSSHRPIHQPALQRHTHIRTYEYFRNAPPTPPFPWLKSDFDARQTS